MSIEELKAGIPDYAKDIKLNLGSVTLEEALSSQQKAGCFITAAMTTGNRLVLDAVMATFGSQLELAALQAAKSAAAIMAMNNVYYRFTHTVGAGYESLPAKLRMSVIGKPGVEKVDFELWSLVASAINGCSACMTSHEKAVREAGLSQDQVQTAMRIAATVRAVALVYDCSPVAP